ncbi:SpoVR family protein [Candidatus Woesearchaeota archaeon]|nr:SpoVR family protein [Candidatus Woesearchaeota archaeon]
MELINQHTKKLMEDCKVKAREAGLKFDKETLEYIVTNRDLLELSPKIMIPTLYDYWVHDVYVLQEKGKYEIFPHNPYETVINTRPAISFYNDNNPDWLNVMIFYHVIGHIDFFQNNKFYRGTWKDDFTGKALADKRLMAKMRIDHGRWVDYLIEFSRGIDNLVGFHNELANSDEERVSTESKKVDFYFDVFLQNIKKVSMTQYLKEMERYNETLKKFPDVGETLFFSNVIKEHPEFDSLFEKHVKDPKTTKQDLVQYLDEHSEFLNKDKNKWMKLVMDVVRDTSLYFQPQLRDHIMNEGWASYWHDKLFMQDEAMKTHEIDFSIVNSKVMSIPFVGLNPYAIGWRLWMHIEEQQNKGKYSYEYQKITDAKERKAYDKKVGGGKELIFRLREDLNDFMFVNSFIDQEFMDKHNLFVVGQRINMRKGVMEYYIRSKKAEDYKKMMVNKMYHPPHIKVNSSKAKEGELYLDHIFEDKPLYKQFIPMTMMGLEYLWGNTIKLETSEIDQKEMQRLQREAQEILYSTGMLDIDEFLSKQKMKYRRVLYTMKDKDLSKEYIDEEAKKDQYVFRW